MKEQVVSERCRREIAVVLDILGTAFLFYKAIKYRLLVTVVLLVKVIVVIIGMEMT